MYSTLGTAPQKKYKHFFGLEISNDGYTNMSNFTLLLKMLIYPCEMFTHKCYGQKNKTKKCCLINNFSSVHFVSIKVLKKLFSLCKVFCFV